MDQQRAARAIGPLEAGKHVAAPRRTGFHILDLVADLFQLSGNPPGTFRLAHGGFQIPGISGVKPDQPADNVHHVVDGCFGWHRHSDLSYHCGGAAARRLTSGVPVWAVADRSDSLSCQLLA
jgi:hypothetical protein